MILADTTTAIDFLRAPTPRARKIMRGHQASICGVTIAEVYAGARKAAELKRYATVLGLFGRVTIPEDVWPQLGRNLSALRAMGITVPFSDALIATVAIENDLELWHKDVHFPMIQSVLPQLKLFQEPP